MTLQAPSSLASACATRRGLSKTNVTGTMTFGPVDPPTPFTYYQIGDVLGGTTPAPTSITTGPDGALWFTLEGGHRTGGPHDPSAG